MFSFFSRNKNVVGLEITSSYVRFVELAREGGSDKIISYGEYTPDEKDQGLDPKEKLARVLGDIKKKLKARRWNVSLSHSALLGVCQNVFHKIGLKPAHLSIGSTPAIKSCVPDGSDTSFLIIHAEQDSTDIIISDPNGQDFFFKCSPENYSIISSLNHIYIDWYDKHKEKIHHALVSGPRAGDSDFIDYISRETKIPLQRANVFVNLHMNHHAVPILPKPEAPKYAVAIGLAIS